jgi:AcrR family transcriptional regulator
MNRIVVSVEHQGGKNMSAIVGMDRRINRTREAIREAMIDLIDEKGFESISIKDITDRANINRGTFYLHYHDKFDLLDQTENEIIERMKEILLSEGSWGFEEYINSGEPMPVIVSLFNYIKSHARLMRAILGLKANPNFQGRLKKAIESNLNYLGVFGNNNQSALTVPGEYLVSYVAAAHLGVVQIWLENNCRESPQEMALILSQLSFNGPFRAIREQAGQS